MFLDREWEQRNAEDELPQVWKLGIPVGEWWIERLLVQARWVTVVSSLSLLLLRPTVHWIWPLLLAAYYGIGNGIVHARIAPPKTFQDWKIGRTLAICIDWLGACFALLLFDASLTIGTTLFILLIGVTSLRSCTSGALGATFASGLVLLVCALHIWLIHDVPWNRLFPFLAGSLVTLAVAEGDQVEQGDTVATIEAMKMEAAITAPKAGTVERLAINAVQQVEGGDLLVVLK